MLYKLLILFSIFFSVSEAYSQIDPLRAALLTTYTKDNRNILETQSSYLGPSAMAHKFSENEKKKIIEFQAQFENYLTRLDTTMTYLADIYAFYYEIKTAIKNVQNIKNVVIKSPLNIAGLAMSKSRSNIYYDLIDSGTSLIMDVTEIFKKNGKTGKTVVAGTTYDRFEAMEHIRRDLKDMNIKLRRFSILLKCTSLLDSWYEISELKYHPDSPREIAQRAYARWRRQLYYLH